MATPVDRGEATPLGEEEKAKKIPDAAKGPDSLFKSKKEELAEALSSAGSSPRSARSVVPLTASHGSDESLSGSQTRVTAGQVEAFAEQSLLVAEDPWTQEMQGWAEAGNEDALLDRFRQVLGDAKQEARFDRVFQHLLAQNPDLNVLDSVEDLLHFEKKTFKEIKDALVTMRGVHLSTNEQKALDGAYRVLGREHTAELLEKAVMLLEEMPQPCRAFIEQYVLFLRHSGGDTKTTPSQFFLLSESFCENLANGDLDNLDILLSHLEAFQVHPAVLLVILLNMAEQSGEVRVDTESFNLCERYCNYLDLLPVDAQTYESFASFVKSDQAPLLASGVQNLARVPPETVAEEIEQLVLLAERCHYSTQEIVEILESRGGAQPVLEALQRQGAHQEEGAFVLGNLCHELFNSSFAAQKKELLEQMEQASLRGDLTGLYELVRSCSERYMQLAPLLQELAARLRDKPEAQNVFRLMEKSLAFLQNEPMGELEPLFKRAALLTEMRHALSQNDIARVATLFDAVASTGLGAYELHALFSQELGHEALQTFASTVQAAKYENRRTDPLAVLKKFVLKAGATSILRKCCSSKDLSSLNSTIRLMQKYGAPAFKVLMEEMGAVFASENKQAYEAEMQARLAQILEDLAANPSTSTKELHAFIDEAQANQLDPQVLLLNARTDSSFAALYIERVLAKFSALLRVPYGEVRLNPYELLRITCVAERELLQRSVSTRLKATDAEVNLARSVIIDPKTKSFSIISGQHGPVKAEGGAGKVRSVIVVGDTILNDVRKTLLKGQKPRPRTFNPQELKYAEMFMKLGTVVVYTQGGQEKQSVTMERFTTDFAELLSKGTKAFENEREMLQAFDQVLETLETAHTQNIVHGDVKAANILYKKGKAQLADWGFAADVKNPKEVSAVPGHATPMFSPPEDLLRKSAALTAEERQAIDMFGMGSILSYYISVCESEAKRGEGLWKPNGDAPWSEKLELHFRGKPRVKQDITTDVQNLRNKLKEVKHPLAPLAEALLNPNPAERMTVKQARASLASLLSK